MTVPSNSRLSGAVPESAEPIPSDTTEPAPGAANRYLGAGAAQLFAFGVLAVVNQLLLLGKGLPPPTSVRLLHHAYDAGQLLAAGGVSFVLIELVAKFAPRLGLSEHARWPRSVVMGLVCFAVSLLVVRGDVSNAAARYGVPVWLAMVAASLTFGLLLGATPWLGRLRGLRARGALFLAGLVGGIANAFILLGDYPAAHLMLAWFSALLMAAAVEGVLPSPKVGGLPLRVLAVVLALWSLAAVSLPPPQAVLGRLYGLSSSVLAPFVARFYPAHGGPALELVRREYLTSPWFQPRNRLSPLAPSRALALPAPKIVVLLTVDALRADVVAEPEYLRRFPGFSRLHQSCAHFSQARGAASSTRASLASVFTGVYYSQARSTLTTLQAKEPRLPALVSAAGVRTVSLPRLNRISVGTGVTQGFQREIKHPFRARALVDKIIETLGDKRPTFLYAHFGEPHAPYQGKGSRFQRYLQEVGRVDGALLRLIEFLKESGLVEHTRLIVSADHGEGFGEHGVYSHARVIYEEVARVPLFVCGPGVKAREVTEPVSLIDLAPTILDAFELPTPGVYMGQSLLPLAAGGTEPLRRPIAIHATHGLAGFYFPDGKKVIFNVPGKTVEVYDLSKDPGEKQNLSDAPEPDVRSAIETARLFFHQHQVALEREYPSESIPLAAEEGGMEPEE